MEIIKTFADFRNSPARGRLEVGERRVAWQITGSYQLPPSLEVDIVNAMESREKRIIIAEITIDPLTEYVWLNYRKIK